MFPDWKFPYLLSLLSILTSCRSRLSERLPDFFSCLTGRTHAMLGKGGVKYTVPVRNELSLILGDPGTHSGDERKSIRAGKCDAKKSKERREELHIYFSARLDFPSPPLSAPGSPRMAFSRQCLGWASYSLRTSGIPIRLTPPPTPRSTNVNFGEFPYPRKLRSLIFVFTAIRSVYQFLSFSLLFALHNWHLTKKVSSYSKFSFL